MQKNAHLQKEIARFTLEAIYCEKVPSVSAQ